VEDLNRVLKGLQKATLRDFPNPERVGCPGAAVIEALANRRLAHTHEAVQHITHCSPCYAEFLAIRRRIRHARLLRTTAIAACVLFAIGVTSYFLLHSLRPEWLPFQGTMASVTLDLRPYSALRGADQSVESLPPLRLPTERLHVILQLPVGADEGLYRLRINNSVQQVLLEKQASASLKDHVLTAESTLDLRHFAPGRYELALQTGQDGWHTYPLVIGTR
jgi:hypothetical protein